MADITDSRKKLDLAKECLDKKDYANFILNSQMGVETALKSLLDMLGVSYKRKQKDDREAFVHDVSDSLKDAFDKLLPYYAEYDQEYIKQRLAKAGVMLKCLLTLKDFCIYGNKNLQIAGSKIFDFSFREFAVAIDKLAGDVYWFANEAILRVEQKG